MKKQKDLSGFYRHLLNQTVGEEAIPDRSANKSVIASHYLLTDEHVHVFFFFFRSLYYITVSFTDLKLQRIQKTQKRLHLLPRLHPMKISQVQAVTSRRHMSRNLGLASLGAALHTQNASTGRGHLHQGAVTKRRGKRRRSETDIKRATETKTEQGIEIESEKETETGEGKEMTGMEKEEATEIEGETETEVEKTTEVEEAEVIPKGTTGMERGRGAPEKENGIRMGRGKREGNRMKTRGKTDIWRKSRHYGRNQRRRRA